MELVILILAVILKILRVLLPWAVGFFLTKLFMGLAGIKGGYVLPVFLFGFVLLGLFLRDEVFPVFFKDK